MPTQAPTAEVIAKLDTAMARRQGPTGFSSAPPAPSPRKQPTVMESSPNGGAAPSGGATAKYLLVDHFFGGATGSFWGYDGTNWYGANTGEPADEAGIEQVAFASNRVDLTWDDTNVLTLVRCWKYL